MFLRKSTDKTDEELLRLYQTTHQLQWLGDLYLKYTSLVYGVCLKYLKDREEAKDAVMQIHEKLITTLLRHEVNHFRSWLYVNARNHCLMQLRSSKGRVTEDISVLLMENDPNGHHEEELELDIQKLKKCIETLADPQQKCVKLFYLEEKCYKEIGTETGFEVHLVKSYIQNGKRNLKICMEANG